MAILDWGFGHLTRSIPIIEVIAESSNHLHVCVTKEQLNFLEKILNVEWHIVDGYDITFKTDRPISNHVTLATQLLRESRMIRR